MPKNVQVGVVTSDRGEKTRRVEVRRRVKHPMYGKYIRRRTVCHVHDEDNTSKLGDTVEIIESRPRSKTKRWELVRVVQESRAVDLAALRAAAKVGEVSEETEALTADEDAGTGDGANETEEPHE